MSNKDEIIYEINDQAVFICQKCSNSFVTKIGAWLDGEGCPVCEDVQTVQEVESGYYYRSRADMECPSCVPVQ